MQVLTMVTSQEGDQQIRCKVIMSSFVEYGHQEIVLSEMGHGNGTKCVQETSPHASSEFVTGVNRRQIEQLRPFDFRTSMLNRCPPIQPNTSGPMNLWTEESQCCAQKLVTGLHKEEHCSCKEEYCSCKKEHCSCEEEYCSCEEEYCSCEEEYCSCEEEYCSCEREEEHCSCEEEYCSCEEEYYSCEEEYYSCEEECCKEEHCSCEEEYCSCIEEHYSCEEEHCSCKPTQESSLKSPSVLVTGSGPPMKPYDDAHTLRPIQETNYHASTKLVVGAFELSSVQYTDEPTEHTCNKRLTCKHCEHCGGILPARGQ